MNNAEIYSELKQSVNDWMDKARAVYPNITLVTPVISLDLRGVVAGKASFSLWRVKYNPTLFLHNKEAFKDRTVPHEIAHLIAKKLYGIGIKPHGVEWKFVMRKLGVKDIGRCHSYDVSVVSNRPYVYKCNCTEHKLSPLIHNKILSGQTRFCCSCKAQVHFVGKVA